MSLLTWNFSFEYGASHHIPKRVREYGLGLMWVVQGKTAGAGGEQGMSGRACRVKRVQQKPQVAAGETGRCGK
ncbi:hypothetical protein [Glutamicibacter soli]